MTSKERVLASLNHREPDAVPVDFGSTAVTGIHVNAIAGLLDRYGLEKRPGRGYEPYQMLGLLDKDLKKAMGIDVEGIPAPETLFGFRNENWKPYRLDSGLEVLVSEHFRTTKDPDGDTLIYPTGDLSAPPRRGHRTGGHGHFRGHGLRRHRPRPCALPQTSQGHPRHRGMVYLHRYPPGIHPPRLR